MEGLVHVTSLVDDYYIFDEDNYQLVGEQFKRAFRLGDEVRVRVAEVDLTTKTIDFILA